MPETPTTELHLDWLKEFLKDRNHHMHVSLLVHAIPGKGVRPDAVLELCSRLESSQY